MERKIRWERICMQAAIGIRARSVCVYVLISVCVCVCLRVEAAVHTASRPGGKYLTQHQLRWRSDMTTVQGQRSSACVLNLYTCARLWVFHIQPHLSLLLPQQFTNSPFLSWFSFSFTYYTWTNLKKFFFCFTISHFHLKQHQLWGKFFLPDLVDF